VARSASHELQGETTTESPHSRLARFRPGSPLGLALLGLALCGLLALVAAVARAHHTPGGRSGIHEPPRGVGNYLFSIGAVVAVSIALFIVYLWFSERDLLAEAHRKRQRKGMRRVIAILLIGLALVPALASRFHLWSARDVQQRQKVNPGKPAQSTKKTNTPGAARAPEFEWLPVFVATTAGVLLLGFIGLRAMRRQRVELLSAHRLELELESLLDDTLADLHAMKDPREAIIAAYTKMERLFAAYGLPRAPSEAPMEYMTRALGELRASGASLRRLTALFQWAKFSTHDVDAKMRADAISALTDVRDELRANRREDELAREQREALERDRADAADDREQTHGEDPFATLGEKVRGDVYTQR
jgi:Domain of unknown function (DUF4129)